ncbi:MAG: N-6 DNA methylase [Prevotellaceae bacterium]|nr:N-6 DNA methylase [Prevotellaceae bacterium]
METEKLERAIERMTKKTGASFSNCFEDFLDAALATLCNNPNQRQKDLIRKLDADKSMMEAFKEAMTEYGAAAEGFSDPLGEVFMNRISHGEHGQYFTPEHVCEMMALAVNPGKDTICDPACGSGRMLLASLKVCRQADKEPILYGNDLSSTCAKMTLLNLLVNTAKGEVTCGDALLDTTAYRMFYHIDRIHIGQYLVSTYWQYDQSDVEEVNNQRNAWIVNLLNEGLIVERTDKAETISLSEIVNDKPVKNETLTAKPKTAAIQLDLFNNE